MTSRGAPDAIGLQTFLSRLIWWCAAPLLVLATYLAYQNLQEIEARRDDEAVTLAKHVADEIDARLRSRIRGLQVLALSPELDDRARWQHFYNKAQDFRAIYGHHIVFADGAGKMLLNTRLPFGAELPAIPRPKGRSSAEIALATARPAVGDLFLGPLAKEPLIAISVPVLRNGRVAYLLIATVEASGLQVRLDDVIAPPEWRIVLRDATGEIVAQRTGTVPVDYDSGRKLRTSALKEAPWSLTVEVPKGILGTTASFRRTAIALALVLLAVAVVAVAGGGAAARRLVRSLKTLADAGDSEAVGREQPMLRIKEVETIRERLQTAERERQVSEARFLATFEQAAVGISQLAPDGHWLRVNRKLCEIVGYSRDELLAMCFQEITHPDDLDTDLEQVCRMLAHEIETYSLEKRYIRKDGRVVWINLTVSMVSRADGAPDYFVSVVEDIDARKTVEAQLQLWAGAFERAEFAVAIGDARSQVFRAVNPAFARGRGYAQEELVGTPILQIFPPDRVEEAKLAIRAADESGHGIVESEHQCKDGSRFPVMLDITVIKAADGMPVTRIVYALDIGDRVRAEQALRESASQLHALAAKLVAVREEERARLAREVHDQLGQMLTGLSLDTGWLVRRVARVADVGLRQEMSDKLGEIGELTVAMIRTVQEITSEMRPSVLDNLGLAAALRFEGERFAARSGLECIFDLPEQPLEMPAEVATALFRICQENLTNVARHARATRVGIRLAPLADGVLLEVSDNGCGITLAQKNDAKSLGLLGMRERVAQIGGRVVIDSAAGRGTTVTVRVP